MHHAEEVHNASPRRRFKRILKKWLITHHEEEAHNASCRKGS